MKVIPIILITILCLLFVACGGVSSNTATSSNTSVTSTHTNNSVDVCTTPKVIGLAVDQSGSMKWSGTPQVTVADLQPLIDELSVCGGELGITFIRGYSNLGIERLLFPEYPRLPAPPVQASDKEDYEFSDRLTDYNQKAKDRQTLIEKQRGEMKPQIEAFLQRVKPLLEKPPKGGTDFNTAVNRADIFLAESNTTWKVEPTKFLVVVSDAVDTKKQTKNHFKSNAQVLWVNAVSSEKVLADLNFMRFESFSSAVRFIVNNQNKEGGQNNAHSK